MSDPTLSDVAFENKMVLVWTTLNKRVMLQFRSSKFEPHKAPDIKEQYQNDYGSYIGQQAYDYVYQQRNHMQQSLGY